MGACGEDGAGEGCLIEYVRQTGLAMMPPRLARNVEGVDPFAVVYDWPASGVGRRVLLKIHTAFMRRRKTPCGRMTRLGCLRITGGGVWRRGCWRKFNNDLRRLFAAI